jgi:glucan phosphorylase
MFKQLIKDGYQAEVPDIWLEQGNPWEVKRHDIKFEVAFSGKTTTDKGKTTWIPGEKVSQCAQSDSRDSQGCKQRAAVPFAGCCCSALRKCGEHVLFRATAGCVQAAWW